VCLGCKLSDVSVSATLTACGDLVADLVVIAGEGQSTAAALEGYYIDSSGVVVEVVRTAVDEVEADIAVEVLLGIC